MKKYTIEVSESAERDIAEAIEYIDTILYNPAAADSLLDAIEEAFSDVSVFPEGFPLAKDTFLASLGIRVLVINNYLALYTVNEAEMTVHIVRFLYGKRNWQSIIKNDVNC